jgi:bacteriorhodopsin
MLVSLHTAIQFWVFVVSLISFVFYAYQKWQGLSRVDWQVVYVVGVEALIYAILMTMPTEYVPLNGVVPVWRYVSWMATCPVLLSGVVRLVRGDNNFTVLAFPLLSDIWMNLFGILAAFFSGAMKAIMFGCGCAAAMFMYYCLSRIAGSEQARKLPLYSERVRIMYFLMVSWVLFPVLFILGPEFTGVITFRASSILHGLGDLISKNMMGYLSWRLGVKMNKLLGKGVEADWDVNDLENPVSTTDKDKASVELMPSQLKQAKVIKRGAGSKEKSNETPRMADVVKRMMLLERIMHKGDGEKFSFSASPQMQGSYDVSENPQLKSPIQKSKSIEQDYIESKMHEYLKKYESSPEGSESIGPDHTLSRGSTSSSPQYLPVTEVFSRYKSTPQGRLVSPSASEKALSECDEVV